MVTGTVLCNNVLVRAFDEGINVNPRKLQKLLYYIALDYLENNGELLFSEAFSTWKHGPVLQSVYEEFMSYDDKPIITFARDSVGNVKIVDELKESAISKSIENVWQDMKNMSGDELTERSHEAGSAWSIAKSHNSPVITEEFMRKEIEARHAQTATAVWTR